MDDAPFGWARLPEMYRAALDTRVGADLSLHEEKLATSASMFERIRRHSAAR